MPELYLDTHRRLQEQHETRALADRLVQLIVHDTFNESDISFISTRDFFFLSSVDPTGRPTVSYKGGAVGFAKIIDNVLIFPCYDGNGMFLSMGNIVGNPKVGLLFIDFETPRRLRVQGNASLDQDGAADLYAGALAVVRVQPEQIFVNCGRYIHRHVKVEQAEHVPRDDGTAPLARWKRLDIIQDALPSSDRARAEAEGLVGLQDAEAAAASGKA